MIKMITVTIIKQE